ncbi:MAG: antibiotic biosynthesis monooxygenase [Cyanobacteria bacterium P01_H01_bin.15]
MTAVITHRVRPGRQQGYEQWLMGIAAAARNCTGHLGVNILRPQESAVLTYVIVLQFDTCTHLDDWLKSEVRRTWIERVQPLIQEQESIQVLTGLEGWFQLPSHFSNSVPKRYKQALLVWVGVVGISLGISPLMMLLSGFLPWLVVLAIRGAISVLLLSYVVMPRLTRWFKRWLFA